MREETIAWSVGAQVKVAVAVAVAVVSVASLTLPLTALVFTRTDPITPRHAAKLASSPVAVVAQTFYVAPTGRDANVGTLSAPFATVKKGLLALKPGNTLVVRGGTYTERIRSLAVTPGQANARINVKAYPGERPVIVGLFGLKGLDYWTVDGINVTWDPVANSSNEHMVKFTDGTGWRYTNAEVWGARSFAGILVAGSPVNWQLDHLYVHDTYASNSKNQDHLIYANTGTGGGVIERNVLAHSPNGRAIKIGPSSPGTTPVGNITVRYNTMYDNGGPSNVQLSYGASGNEIYRNIMVQPLSGQPNVTAFNLNGNDNIAYENIGWQSTGVAETGQPGLTIGAGNLMVNPLFVSPLLGDYRPLNVEAALYGAAAPGDTIISTTTTSTTPAPTTTAPTTTTTAPTTTTTAPTTTTTRQPTASAVTLRSASKASNLRVTTVTIAKPLGTSSGDVLLATVDARGSGAIQAPAGWTLVRSDLSGTTLEKRTWWRLAGSSEPQQYTWSFDKERTASGAILAYYGVSSTDPILVAAGQANPRGTTLTAPAVTAPVGTVVVASFGTANDVTVGAPPGTVERAEVASAVDLYNVTTEVADMSGKGISTGALVATASSSAVNIGQTLVLRRAA
jgi:hypothetical protein